MIAAAMWGTVCGLFPLAPWIPFLAFVIWHVMAVAFFLNLPAAAALRRLGDLGQPLWKTLVAVPVVGVAIGLGTRAVVLAWTDPEYVFVCPAWAACCGVVDAAGMTLWLRLES